MTGFGRARAEGPVGAIGVEVRCVNSRHLDVRVRLPRELASLEMDVRKRVSGHFLRGQVDVGIRLPRELEGTSQVEVDRAAVREYAQAAAALGQELGLDGALSLPDLLALPGVARLKEHEAEPDRLSTAVYEALDVACAAAAAMREREGEALEGELRERLASVSERVDQICERAKDVQDGQRARLERRLANLAPQVEVDPTRLEQELVLYLDRMDITEEMVRLRSHCVQFLETMEQPGAVGRKLEFILQEMGREANTAGSKASDAPIAREVVELKAEFEKLREQVLNVE